MSLKAIDTAFETLYATLAIKQAKYLAAKGRCFQGLTTHADTPDSAKAPDRKTAKPHYQAEDWAACEVALPAMMAYSLRVDQYVTPSGECGWVATIKAVVDGVTWTRSKGEGPEQRDTEWTEVKPLDTPKAR